MRLKEAGKRKSSRKVAKKQSRKERKKENGFLCGFASLPLCVSLLFVPGLGKFDRFWLINDAIVFPK